MPSFSHNKIFFNNKQAITSSLKDVMILFFMVLFCIGLARCGVEEAIHHDINDSSQDGDIDDLAG